MNTLVANARVPQQAKNGRKLLVWGTAATVLLLAWLSTEAAEAPIVRARLALEGQRVVYTYTLINPTEAAFPLEEFLLVTDEIAFPYPAGDPAAPPDIPCHFLPRPFLDSEEGRRAVIYGLSRRPLPSGGEIGGLSYATKALPAVGYVVLHRPAEAEREALLEKALHRGKVPTDEPFRRLRRSIATWRRRSYSVSCAGNCSWMRRCARCWCGQMRSSILRFSSRFASVHFS